MEGPVAANNIMEGSIMLVLSRKIGESIFISESIWDYADKRRSLFPHVKPHF
jgi:Global regulator protein family